MMLAKNTVLIIVIFTFITILPNFTSAWSSDYDSWQYRKAIAINGSESGLTDYQVPINLTTTFYNNTGLVGSWHFSVNSTEDSSGNGNNGVQNGGVNCSAVGKVGGGCEFDGNDDYIDMGDPANSVFDFGSGNFTLSVWIKTSTSSDFSAIIEKSWCESMGGGYILGINSGKAYIGTLSVGSPYTTYASTGIVNDSSWHHIVGIRADTAVKLYIDGVYDGEYSGTLWDIGNAQPFTIGKRNSCALNDLYFNGTIDEVRIYDRALSAQEIADQYNAGKARLDLQDLRFAQPYNVYELPINISGADLIDYQVLINITDTTIISHMRSDGGDLRFFNYTTDTPYSNQTLPFWVENISANQALIWLKTNVSASGSIIYMYYGNVSATYNNSLGGNSTFEFFDDFSSMKAGYSSGGGGGTWTVSGGVLSFDGHTPPPNWWSYYLYNVGAPPYTITARLKINTADNWFGLIYREDSSFGQRNSIQAPQSSTGSNVLAQLAGGISGDYTDSANSIYHNYEVRDSGSAAAFYYDRAYRSSSTSSTNNGLTYAGFGTPNDGGTIDYWHVRKYSATEPTAIIGSETVKSANNEAQLNHWQESDNIAWVKVPSVAASANTTLYMYYGNPGAASASNSPATFMLDKTFSGEGLGGMSEINYSNYAVDWQFSSGGSAVEDAANSKLDLSASSNPADPYNTRDIGYITDNSLQDFVYQVKVNSWSASLYNVIYVIWISQADNDDNVFYSWQHNNGQSDITKRVSDVETGFGTSPGDPTNKHYRVLKTGQLWITQSSDDGLSWTDIGSSTISDWSGTSAWKFGVVLRPSPGDASNQWTITESYDYIRVRKYASQEPTVLSIGAEETHPVYWLKTYSSSGNAKSFFAINESVTIKARAQNGSNTITVIDPDGIVIVNNANMANETSLSDSVLVWNYSLNLTNKAGWYDVKILGNEQNDLFFIGGIWQDNWTDSEGNVFPFRIQANVSEPNVIERFFELVDVHVTFTYRANASSIRVAQWNGTNLIDIPSQSYNLSYGGNYAASGNLVFLTTTDKSQNSTYYVYYARTNSAPAYSTDLAVANNSGVYVIQNMNYRIVLNQTEGGVIRDAYNKKGTNENLAGYSPMQLSPEALGGSLYRAFSLATPSISLSEGSIFTSYKTAGTYGNMKFNITYKHYSHTPYIVLETNVRPAAGETWDYYYDQNFRLKDGYFSKATWKNSTGIFEYSIGAGNGADMIVLGDIGWIAVYNNASANSFGTIFLSNSQSQSVNLNSEFYDDSSYERYRRRQFSGNPSGVIASDYFYSKTAIVMWNALDGYEKLNETYYALTYPINISSGNSETSDIQNPIHTSSNHAPQNPADNESVTCFSYWTDNLMLDYAVVVVNSSRYDNQSVVQMNSNGGWINHTINAAVLEAGNVTCNIIAYDIVGLSNSTSISFNVSDTNAPYFGQTTNTPSDNISLDPDVSINITVNITEYSNISSVILQYKNASAAEWQNIGMDKTWNGAHNYSYFASFVPESESIWQYRVYANDTLGNANYSQVTNLSVYYDWVWRPTPADFGAISGVFGSNITVGSLAINNTADAEIVFRLTSNWHDTDKVYFNGTSEGSDGFNITVGNNGVATVSVKVTAQQIERIDGLNLTISSLNSSAIPLKNSTSATIVSYASGPFLLVDITEYPISSTQGDSNVVLKAKVQNKGNETATGVWLAFELPTGWTATSGSLNKSIGVLAVDSIGYNQISASISESAATGAQTLSAKSGSFQNKTGLDSVNLAVAAKSTSSTVTETIVTSPGGGAAGASASTSPVQTPGLTREQKEKLFQTEETYELVRGKSDNFTLKIENPLEGDLEDVSVSVSGFLSQYLNVVPSNIKRIPAEGSSTVVVHITAPKYFTGGTHYLNFTISGTVRKITTSSGNVTKITLTKMMESRSVTLLIQEISRDDALQYIEMGVGIVREINMTGLANRDLEMLITQAENALRNRNYADVKAIYEALTEKKEKLMSTLALLEEVSTKIGEAEHNGITVSTTLRLMMLARSALERGDYDTALKRAEDAKMTYALETTGKMNMMVYAKNNWRPLGAAAVLLIILSYLVFLSLKYNLVNQKLKSLRNEEDVLMSLIKEIQRECFDEGKMSMDEYIESLLQYEKKMSSVIKETINAESVKANMFRFFRSFERTLNEERAKLLDLIKNTQSMYLESGKIETRVYEFRMKSYAERLAEIEEKLADIDAKRTIRKQSFGV